jgi:hypothetical protein
LKDIVYNSNPRKQEELKENIPAEQVQGVNQNPFRQREDCLRVQGQHLERLL